MAVDVEIPVGDGTRMRAALAVPMGTGPRPGVVVLHEVFGLNDDIRAKADRFAYEGYAAVAPDLFSHGNRLACLARAMREVALGRPGPVTADVEASRRWLADHDDIDAGRTAVVGFCMGGGFALVHAATAPAGLRAAGVFYGAVPKDRSRIAGICPVVASYGGRDLVLRRHAQRLERHLTELGVPHDVKTYPNVGHSFMTPGSEGNLVEKLLFFPVHAGYGETEAEDGWRRLFAFLREHV